jgi:hypothetical protein
VSQELDDRLFGRPTDVRGGDGSDVLNLATSAR